MFVRAPQNDQGRTSEAYHCDSVRFVCDVSRIEGEFRLGKPSANHVLVFTDADVVAFASEFRDSVDSVSVLSRPTQLLTSCTHTRSGRKLVTDNEKKQCTFPTHLVTALLIHSCSVQISSELAQCNTLELLYRGQRQTVIPTIKLTFSGFEIVAKKKKDNVRV